MLSKFSNQGVHVEGATLIYPCLTLLLILLPDPQPLVLYLLPCPLCVIRELGIEFPCELNPISLPKGLVVILQIFFLTHIHKKLCVLLNPFSIKLSCITSSLYNILNDLGHLSDMGPFI
jgi:hypothetical protein